MVIDLLKCIFVSITIFFLVFSNQHFICKFISFGNLLALVNTRTKRRISENNIETLLKNSIYIQETVMVMYTAMSIAVHNHIHLRGSCHSRVSIRSINTIMRQIIHTTAFDLCIQLFIQLYLHCFNARVNSELLLFGESIIAVAFKFSTQLDFSILDIFFNLFSYILKGLDQEAAATTSGVTDSFPLFGVENMGHKVNNRAGCKELSKFASEGCS